MALIEGIAAHLMDIVSKREAAGLQTILDHHNEHMKSGTYRRNKDGSMSTVVSTIISDSRLNGGRETVIPLLWNGKQLSHKEAIKKAIASKKPWPSADTVAEAEALDRVVHSRIYETLRREGNAPQR